MSEYLDIGVNLTHKSLLPQIDAVLQRATEVGVLQMVVTGTELAETEQAIKLCELYPRQLVCTAGVHPHHASDWLEPTAAALEQLATRPCVRAIGETGLDFNRDFSPRDAQIHAFRQQLELAVRLRKPVFTHQRDAHECFVSILREYRDRLSEVVVHCFTDNREALEDYLALDCHIGITGWICDERRGVELQGLVKYIPPHRLMVETDAPYLLPRDLARKPTTRINEPAYLPHIVATVARHQDRPVALVAEDCLATSRRFFGL